MDYFFKNNYVILTNYVPTDIYPIQYGAQQCRSDYMFGPCVWNNYVLHYVYSGKGVLKINNSEYEISAGQMFLIRPGLLVSYQADKENPWLYRWIEFNGSLSSRIMSVFDNATNHYVIEDCSERLLGDKLKSFVDEGEMNFEFAMEKLWSFINTLTQNFMDNQQTQSQDYARMADEYVLNNIHKKLTVIDIAKHLKINRSYLSRLFKQYKNISLQQYIIGAKMNTAAQYLKNTDMSVAETAQSVGYTDYHIFNKMFKQHFHLPPSEWRKQQVWEQSILNSPVNQD